MDYFKVGGSWKETSKIFIKEGGKWIESPKQFIKVGGHWADVSNLSANALDYDMAQGQDPSTNERYFINKSNPNKFKAAMHSGRALSFQHRYSKSFILLPLDTTNGSEFITNGIFDTDVTGWTPNHNCTVALDNNAMRVVRIGSTSYGIVTCSDNITLEPHKTYRVKCKLKEFAGGQFHIYVGNKKIYTNYHQKVGAINHTYTVGDTELKKLKFYSGSLVIDDISLTEETINTQTILYYSPKAKRFTSMAPTTGLQFKKDFSDLVTLNKTLTTANLDYLSAHPDTVRNIWFDDVISEAGFTKADMTSFLPANKNMDKNVWDYVSGTNIEIQAYTSKCRSIYKDISNGPQELNVKPDFSGKAAAGTIEPNAPQPPMTVLWEPTAMTTADWLPNNEIPISVQNNELTLERVKVNRYNNLKAAKGKTIYGQGYQAVRYTCEVFSPSVGGAKKLTMGLGSGGDTKLTFTHDVWTPIEFLQEGGVSNSALTFQYDNRASADHLGIVKVRNIKIEATKIGKIPVPWIDLPMVDNKKKHHIVTKCLTEIKGDITKVIEVECTP